MKKALRMFGVILLTIVGIIAATVIIFLVAAANSPVVPNDYMEKVETGGATEAKYLAQGSHEVNYHEAAAMSSFKKYEVYYPAGMSEMKKPLPAVVFVNGTGVLGSKYPMLQKHMASWGFITIATEEEHAWNGFSAEMCVRYLERLNTYEGEVDGKANPFFGKIDMTRIGITGHSQGGIGVFNAITEQRHADIYKAAVILSATQTPMAAALQWEFDETRVSTPVMMLASTGTVDNDILIPLEQLEACYDSIPATVPKIMARRNTGDHGEMLYSGDGYVTAWFMWLLQGNTEAAGAFTGPQPEILDNRLYQDQRIHIQIK